MKSLIILLIEDMNWDYYCIKDRKASIQIGENGLLFDSTKNMNTFPMKCVQVEISFWEWIFVKVFPLLTQIYKQ